MSRVEFVKAWSEISHCNVIEVYGEHEGKRMLLACLYPYANSIGIVSKYERKIVTDQKPPEKTTIFFDPNRIS